MHFVQAKGILSSQNGMNLCRGCTHGCIYCDARANCYHTPIPFEDIEIKQNAPELLEESLKKKRKKCMIGTGSMSDPYLHAEEKLLLTRRCLEIIDKYKFGLAIQTKSDRILRDLDLLESINKNSKCVVQLTLTTADEKLSKIIEPNVCTTYERFNVLKVLQQKKIPTIVWFCPILPFINDSIENHKTILNYCASSGVKGIIYFGAGLTLRDGNREYFYKKLDQFFPGVKEQYQKKYESSYTLVSLNAKLLDEFFFSFCKEHNIMSSPNECFSYLRDYPQVKNDSQLSLF